MKDRMDRREFLTKAGVAALAAPAILHSSLKPSHAAEKVTAESTQPRLTKISIEEHWRCPELDQLDKEVREAGAYSSPLDGKTITHVPQRLVDFEKFRIPEMDEAGIKMQIVSPSAPGVQSHKDVARVVPATKRVNDALAEATRKYPGRFACFAELAMQDPRAAADELERTVTQLGFKGVMFQGHTNGEYYDNQKFWVVWERAEALGVPIYIHIGNSIPEVLKLYEGHPELVGPAWGWGVEAATHALKLIGAGVFDAFPKVMVILGHLGETLPFLLGRLDEGYHMAVKPKALKKPFSQYIKDNILVSTSGKYRPEALQCVVAAMGADRVFFATDFPYVSHKEAVELVERTPLSETDKEKIYHLNAERILKL